MKLNKITSIAMAVCFSFSVLIPTGVALAAPPPPRPPQSRLAKPPQRPHPNNFRKPPIEKHPKRGFHSNQGRHGYYQKFPKWNPGPRHRYRYDSNYYYYLGYKYPRGRHYEGWYHRRHYSMHSDDWLRLLGPVLFFATLSSIGNGSNDIIYID